MTDKELQKIAEEVAHKIYPDAFAWDDGVRGGGQNYVPYYAVDSILPALKQVRDAQKKEDESLVWLSRFRKSEEKLKIAREALDKLARLGMEPYFGNSHGNVIAQKALELMGGE